MSRSEQKAGLREGPETSINSGVLGSEWRPIPVASGLKTMPPVTNPANSALLPFHKPPCVWLSLGHTVSKSVDRSQGMWVQVLVLPSTVLP